MKHTAIYVRVSSNQQDTRSQEPDLNRWTAAFAEDEQVEWYSDSATGTDMNRPGWRRLEANIKAGRVSKVVVWRLDRLGRTASGLTALFDELVRLKVNLVSLKDGVDLSTPAGRLMANVLASVAAYETEVRGERVRAGQDEARRRGVRWGGSRPGRRIKVTHEKERAVRALARLDMGVTDISKATGLSRPSVYRVLGREA